LNKSKSCKFWLKFVYYYIYFDKALFNISS
jgi:hypothetical protein